MRLIEFLLLENRVDFLRKQFQEKIWYKAHEMERNGPGAIKPELFFDILLLADPTQDKKYAQWVIRSYLRGTFRREDIDRIKGWLTRFDQIKSKLEPQQRDIMQYQNPTELYTKVIQPMRKLDATSQRQIDKAIDAQLKAQVRVVYKGPEGAVYVPTTEEASCYLGRGTQWCTAATESNNAFHDYNREGPLYIVMTPDGRKVQMHFESEQFMDETDKAIPTFPAKYKSIRGEPAEEHQKFSLAHNYRWLAKIPEIAKKAELHGALWMFENPNEEMRQNGIRKNWRNLFNIQNPTEDEIELAMNMTPQPRYGHRNMALIEILKAFPGISDNLKLHAVHLDPESIRQIVNPGPEVQRFVAQEKPDLIQIIKDQDPLAMKIAVQQVPRTIAHVKDQTPELQKLAVSRVGSTILDIPHPTREAMELAAPKSGEYLLRASTRFKYQIPDHILITMVKNHPKLMRQIDNPSQRVIDAYNAWLETFDEDAQRYIGGKFVPRPKMKAAESIIRETQAVGFYHVTPARNLKRIKAEGLVPKRGPRSRRLGEPGPSIYLFSSLEEVDNALMNWLGEEFGEDTQLAVLQITPPPGVQFTPSRGAEWEVQTNQPIPPEYIRVLRIE